MHYNTLVTRMIFFVLKKTDVVRVLGSTLVLDSNTTKMYQLILELNMIQQKS
jgi:hypothetical protein